MHKMVRENTARAEQDETASLKKFYFYRHELCLYFGVYFAYLIYGLWTLLQLRGVLQQKSGYTRDPYNYELDIFNDYLKQNWHWYVLHAISTTAARFLVRPDKMGIVFATLSLPSLLSTFQVHMLSYILAMLIIYYLVSYIGSKIILWIVTALWVVVMNILAIYVINPAEGEHESFYTLSVILFWTLLRCCSFALFCIDLKFRKDELLHSKTFIQFLGYTLYFPTLANGPFLDYKRYIAMLSKNSRSSNVFCRQLLTALSELLRVIFWWLILELGMRYLFVHYMAMVPLMAKMVKSPFSRHAIGYFLGQSFFMTYFLKYGLGIAFARYNGMQPPNKPQCIGRVHYYSYMWKHFDQGLYEFLHDYIYQPLCKAHYSKFVSIVFTFGFVFLWHGCQTDILIWTVMNFWCLIAEKFLKFAVRSPLYVGIVERNLGPQTSQRLKAIIFSQLFIVAAFSNVFFIGSAEMGAFLMVNAYGNGPWNYFALSFCCYCFFQCSEVISMKLDKREMMYKKKFLNM